MSETYDNPAGYIGERWWRPIYKVLCEGDNAIFNQMTNLFTLCAAVGHQNKKRIRLENKRDIFKWINLNSDTDIPVLTAIAWETQERDLTVLSDKKKIMDIACEFAEEGMQYLYDNFFEDHMQNNQLYRPENLDIEFNIAQIIEGLRQRESLF